MMHTTTTTTKMKELTTKQEIESWSKDRIWSQSGNNQSDQVSSGAQRVYFPKSTEEVSRVVKALPADTPIAVVGGGCESANLAVSANKDAVVLDVGGMDWVEVDSEKNEVTVGAGTRLQALAHAVRDAGGALPIGTGGVVGCIGYTVNGGISGYFSRRLGLLGQRVMRLTLVTRDGAIRQLTDASAEEDQQLFQCVLGGGSALGIVTSMTYSMASETIFQAGGQFIVNCNDPAGQQDFMKVALTFMKEKVLGRGELDDSVSMEVVATPDSMLICTFIFFDTFEGVSRRDFLEELRSAAETANHTVVVDNVTQWSSWFEAASCLWPVIASMKGSPLAMLQHCCGTVGAPTKGDIEFVSNVWLGKSPLEQAKQSIIEVRTLGGAILRGRSIPTGNARHQFFADMIIAYDAGTCTRKDAETIASQVNTVVQKAALNPGLIVDFSGTHSQPDDAAHVTTGETIFGGAELYERVKATKAILDTQNSFRFHPFHKFL